MPHYHLLLYICFQVALKTVQNIPILVYIVSLFGILRLFNRSRVLDLSDNKVITCKYNIVYSTAVCLSASHSDGHGSNTAVDDIL